MWHGSSDHDCGVLLLEAPCHMNGYFNLGMHSVDHESVAGVDGLGRFHDFRISNYDLMMELISYCVNHDIKDVLQLPDVKERVELYNEQSELFKQQLKEISHMEGKVVVVDQKAAGDVIYAGNRFMIYALYPEAEISVHVAWGFKKQNTAVMIGKSIINKASNFNIGDLCLEYGGGGHANAGTCQIDNDKIDQVLPEIIKKINA